MTIPYEYIFYAIIFLFAFAVQLFVMTAIASGFLIVMQEILLKLDKNMKKMFTFTTLFKFLLKIITLFYCLVFIIIFGFIIVLYGSSYFH